MTDTSEFGTDENQDDPFRDWFEQGDLMATSEEAPAYEEMPDRRSRVGMVIGAVSATALTLVLVVAISV
jgi:hypothetical protein